MIPSLQERLGQKKRLYDVFDSLDKSDEEPDHARLASEALLSKVNTAHKSSATKRTPSSKRSDHLHEDVQTLSDPVNPQTAQATSPDSPSNALPPLRRSVSDPKAMALTSKSVGKRKRVSESLSRPGEQRLFTGLHFYFFPNNDVHPARRMRIAKAVEFGATWEKSWSRKVTHAVLDKNMDVPSLQRYLKLEALPDDVAIVSENYPAECISYRSQLDPALPRFAVKGHKPAPQTTRPQKPGTDNSLPIKSAGKAVQARIPHTPTPDCSTSHSSGHKAAEEDVPAVRVPQEDNALPRETGRIADSFRAIDTTKEFDEAIAKAKALRHLLVDSDDEDNGRKLLTDEASSADEDVSAANSTTHKHKKLGTNQDKFMCMQKHTGDKSDSPNLATINILQQMADYYDQTGDWWRVRAYRQAIATLRKHPKKVSTKEEALALPNIGDRLASKIEEIVYTNRLRRLDATREEPTDQFLRLFMGVYGAGYAIANKWVQQGYRTLDSLLAHNPDLTAAQRIGITHHADFNTRIPRAEVAAHGAVVRAALHALDPAAELLVGGSYRRGAPDSGDIDCIITRPDADAAQLHTLVFGRLVPRLTAAGFLVAALATSSRPGSGGSTWHGASCLPSTTGNGGDSNSVGSRIWRRLDLLLVPGAERGAALIYFTGNDIFNRSLRLLASTKGMRLNQRGLYADVMRGPGRTKVTEGRLLEGRSEERIFELLGVPWRPPEHRIC